MKAYNKLVRDRIPGIIQGEGRECVTAFMSGSEYKTALHAKLIEEAQEVQAAEPGHLATELADVYEVLDALLTVHNITRSSGGRNTEFT